MFNLELFNRPAPRYTSYPTAPQWEDLSPATYAEKLSQSKGPLSLYIHIPFCKTMCLYCGCAVVLNRKRENEVTYVDYLIREIELVRKHLGEKRLVTQLHFGGGTPTKLDQELFAKLFCALCENFEIEFTSEVAIEIDPRTVVEDEGAKLKFLKKLGFNRVSFGVQDTNPKVQEAVKRRQSLEMTQETYHLARQLGFLGINIDLIYGLPFQTPATFRKTVQDICELSPDRIALFSYAKVPWMKPHQKAIPEKTLPSTEQKFQIYEEARATFTQEGYVAIGMDHFAKQDDELVTCYREKRLTRNFQGYSAMPTTDQLGLGVTSIGYVQETYVQNLKDLPSYYKAIDQGSLAAHRGKVLTEEDRLRKWVIHTLMCTFEINKQEFEKRFGLPFDEKFPGAMDDCEADGLVLQTPDKLLVTPLGELLIRLVAMRFDGYLQRKPAQYSSSI